MISLIRLQLTAQILDGMDASAIYSANLAPPRRLSRSFCRAHPHRAITGMRSSS